MTIDITCTVPAPTLAQVRAWLTREGWTVSVGPLGHVPHAERWSHTKHGSAWVPREELNDWLTYISNWIESRAWQIESTPEAVYREIVGPVKVWLVLDHCHASGVIGAHASPESAQRETETYTAPPLLKREASIEEHEVQP